MSDGRGGAARNKNSRPWRSARRTRVGCPRRSTACSDPPWLSMARCRARRSPASKPSRSEEKNMLFDGMRVRRVSMMPAARRHVTVWSMVAAEKFCGNATVCDNTHTPTHKP